MTIGAPIDYLSDDALSHEANWGATGPGPDILQGH
jgi:hypothetical protein